MKIQKSLVLLLVMCVAGFAPLANAGTLEFQFDGVDTVSIVGGGWGPTEDVAFALMTGDQLMDEADVHSNPGSWIVDNTDGSNVDAWGASVGWPAGYTTWAYSCAFYHDVGIPSTLNEVLGTLTATEVGDFGVAMRLWDGTMIDEIYGTAVPEPATMALLGLGGLFIARRRRS